MIKVLVCGGRYLSAEKVKAWLHANAVEAIGGTPTGIIEGGAYGADYGGRMWRRELNIEGTTYYAEWDRYGRSAGMIRNTRMLKEGKPDVVIAFPGGRGTKNMIEIAKHAGVRIIEVQGDFGEGEGKPEQTG